MMTLDRFSVLMLSVMVWAACTALGTYRLFSKDDSRGVFLLIVGLCAFCFGVGLLALW